MYQWIVLQLLTKKFLQMVHRKRGNICSIVFTNVDCDDTLPKEINPSTSFAWNNNNTFLILVNINNNNNALL